MWLTLAFAVVVCVVVLYVPGYMLMRSLSVERFASVAIAPALSIFVFVVLGIVLEKMGITCSGSTLLGIAVVLCLIVLLISKGLGHVLGSSTRHALIPLDNTRQACEIAALYVAIAFAITLVVFLLPIDGPDSFARLDDTTFHFASVRAFLDTGTYSVLHVGAYLDQGVAGGFYPAAWHVVTAVVASFFGNAVPLAANAMVVVLMVFVFPLGMCLLFLKIFKNNKYVIMAGALFVLAFCGFPWGFMVWGQLLSNMVSFMLIPLTLVPLIDAIETKRLSGKIKLALISSIGLIAIALSQPNGVFTFGIWAVLYCLSRIFYLPQSDTACITSKRVIGAIGLFIAACVVWAALYLAPFMQAVIRVNWSATLSPLEAIGSGLLFMFTAREGVQPFLSIAVLAGVIYTCRNRRYLWLSIAYAFALLTYIISVSTDGVLKHVLTGFWYTDYYRTGAMTAFFAIPLASLGFVQLVNLVKVGCNKVLKSKAKDVNCTYLALGIMLVLLLVCQFIPGHIKLDEKRTIYAGLVKVQREISLRYTWDRGLTSEEDVFVKKVMETVPEDALIINVPSDGSCWGYGAEGTNFYFRRSADTGRANAKESELLRTKLCDISTSDDIRRVVNDLDAHYVLMLDESTGDHRTTTSFRYNEENWRGIESINEQTPGFTLLLSEDDMRLYEIDE